MMDQSYLWHQNKPQDHNSMASSNQSLPNSSKTVNGSSMGGHGHAPGNGAEWGHEYGYTNGATSVEPHSQAMQQQPIQQNLYSQGWAPSAYDVYAGYGGSMASNNMNISPATLLAQSGHGGVTNGGQTQDAPTTIDPTLMMTINTPYSQYISPTQTQYHPQPAQQMHRHPSYQHYPMSSLAEVVEYNNPIEPQPPQTPDVSQTNSHTSTPMGYSSSTNTPSMAQPSSAGSSNAGARLQLYPNAGNMQYAAVNSVPLIDQVKNLLTPKQLDKDPQTTATKLINLLIPPSNDGSPTPIAVDKDTRVEILTRLRDHAPKEFFLVFVRNVDALVLMRDWGKHAIKKEEFEETLMGWLQVVDRLPLTVDLLRQAQLGKVVKVVADKPPTTAIKDMASKIEAGWKKLMLNSERSEPEETKPEVRPKKRKAETNAAPSKPSVAGTQTAATSSATLPATKKAAIATATGTKAVRRDSLNTPASVAPTSATTAAASSASASSKPAQSDSSFFSAKPKAKLPSFRKKPAATAAGGTVKTEPEEGKIAQPQAQLPSDYNPFTDALKAVRKGSPVVPPSLTPGAAQGVGGVGLGDRTPGISSKTGKPKKLVRFRPDAELEMIKWIERAIYDDDIPGGSGIHGQSWKDLDRAEGSVWRHMVSELEWYEPQPIFVPETIPTVNRGEFSAEAKTQAEREATALAAIYQGIPPDTPIEPPNLASLPTVDDSSAKTMILGQKFEEGLQVGRQDQMGASHWLSQLGGDAVPGFGGGMANQYGMSAHQLGVMQAAQPQASITELLSKIIQGLPSGDTAGVPSQTATQPAAGVTQDQAGLISALMAAQSAYYGAGQPPPNSYPQAGGYGGAYGGADGYGAPAHGYGDNPATGGLPPPLHDGMPRDDEDRWKRDTKGRGRGKQKGEVQKVPASQNTRSPICMFWQQGRCRFGEECGYSHDPSRLKGS